MPATRSNPYPSPQRPALVDGLVAKVAKLKAENIRLRRRVAELEASALAAENARLRQRVAFLEGWERARVADRARRRWKGLDLR